MKKQGYIYYVSMSSKGEYPSCCHYGESDLNYKTAEDAISRIMESSRFSRFITQKEYDDMIYKRVFPRMKKAFDDKDLLAIRSTLRNNSNKYSIKIFSELSGVKLDKTMKRRMEQLKDYYGAAWDEMEAEREAAQEAREKAEAAKIENKRRENVKSIIEKIESEGQDITGEEFVTVCDEYGISIPLRTRGFCLKTLSCVNIASGRARVWRKQNKKTPNSRGFWTALYELKERMKGAAQCI